MLPGLWNVAVKGYWLLTSFVDDYQKHEAQQEHIKRLVNECCDAALTGHWVPPFREHLEITHQQAKLAQAAEAENGVVPGRGSGSFSPAARKLDYGEGDALESDSSSEDLTQGDHSDVSERPSSVPALPLQDCRQSLVSASDVFSPLTSPRMRKNNFCSYAGSV